MGKAAFQVNAIGIHTEPILYSLLKIYSTRGADPGGSVGFAATYTCWGCVFKFCGLFCFVCVFVSFVFGTDRGCPQTVSALSRSPR